MVLTRRGLLTPQAGSICGDHVPWSSGPAPAPASSLPRRLGSHWPSMQAFLQATAEIDQGRAPAAALLRLDEGDLAVGRQPAHAGVEPLLEAEQGGSRAAEPPPCAPSWPPPRLGPTLQSRSRSLKAATGDKPRGPFPWV